ncbi:MAG TPA: hypothetical protein VLF89_01765 [Candidatus Saccharimonadales bacterium]|nr:hypothetical protein [Candidatus Saccharimonadales bacterium]
MGTEQTRYVIQMEGVILKERGTYTTPYFAEKLKPFGEAIEDTILLEQFATTPFGKHGTAYISPIASIANTHTALRTENRSAVSFITGSLNHVNDILKVQGIENPTFADLRAENLDTLVAKGMPIRSAAMILQIFQKDADANNKKKPITLKDIITYTDTKLYNIKDAQNIIKKGKTRSMLDAMPLRYLYMHGSNNLKIKDSQIKIQVEQWTQFRKELAAENVNLSKKITLGLISIERALENEESDEEETLGSLRSLTFDEVKGIKDFAESTAAFILYIFKSNDTVGFYT